jgi:MSHA biogenesis protein MshP
MKPAKNSQLGFAAIAAVFIVVVLAAFGAFMLTFSSAGQLASAEDVQGARAYWAAQAGIEWGLASTTATACPASPTVLTLETFTVTVTCGVQTYIETGVDRNIFRISSVAASAGNAGDVGYVERSASASIEK